MKKLTYVVLCLVFFTAVYALGEKVQEVSAPAVEAVENAKVVVPVATSNLVNIEVVASTSNAALIATENMSSLLPTMNVNEKVQEAVDAVSENMETK